MYKLCKTEQSATRQRELERGLLSAMLVQNYDEISVSDLCDQMGIPRKSFYRYFSGKQGALYALVDHTFLEYETFSVSGSGREPRTHKRELETYFHYWRKQKPLLDALVRNELQGVLVTRAVHHAVWELGIPNRILLQDTVIARELAMSFTVTGLMAIILRWYDSGFAMTAEELAVIATDLVSKPLFIPDLLI